jgi:hypothetical protein
LGCLLLGAAVPQGTVSRENSDPKNPKVVDEGDYDTGHKKKSRVSLVVDISGRVNLYVSRIEVGNALGEPTLQRFLGRRVSFSDDKSSVGLLPAKVVPTIAYQVNRGTGVRYHVVVAWGLEKRNELVRAVYSIFVLSEETRTGHLRQAYQETAIDENLKAFFVEDVNGDGKAEIIDIGSEGKISVARIRSLDSDGLVNHIQSFGEYEILYVPDYRHGIGAFLLRKPVSRTAGTPDQVCYVQQQLVWSESQKRFVVNKSQSGLVLQSERK